MAPFGSRIFRALPRSFTPAKFPSASPLGQSGVRLGFESLERREMLAADMAEILGGVRVDLQGDGNPHNDVVAVGASARLYRDGGNGVFDGGAGDDILAAPSQQLDPLGRYRFEGLGPGRYFVKIDLPNTLHFKEGLGVRQVDVTSAEALGTVGPPIDGFTSTQRVTASPPLPSSDPSSLVDVAVLGGERDLYVELTKGTDPFSSVALVSGAGLMRLSSDSMVTGNAKIVWDGIDNSAGSINPIGLGGIDLTAHDGHTMTGISLTSGADHPDSLIKLRIYSDANNWSEFVTTVPQTPGGAATQQATFNFSDTPIRQNGVGADFTNVGALELTFEGVSAVDGQISLVGLVGRTTKIADFVASPRMSLGDFVWVDVDNDGWADSDEPGIDGVNLSLYEDANNNNQYDAGTDRFIKSTQTANGGRYLFADLFPGSYVVMVDAANFQSGMPLAAMRSSTGKSPEADPDDNVNNDDNGLAFTSDGVLSRAITLVGNAEPINDGDTNPNSNLTVDFGFYGFDVLVDKSVAPGPVSPGDSLVYTVTVTNSGPSVARNVQFTDQLPSGVEFASLRVNRPGTGLSHQGGVISGTLGDLADDEVVTVTITTTVLPTATGTLVNQVEAIADDELFLDNNRDQVENPVTPKIDLAITKSDEADPVEPGQAFRYTLEIVNLGPSTATGVTVIDTLPADGASYVTASQTPASISGRELRFELGQMAAGAERTITIDVRVDSDFVGTLLNQSRVFANETEITMVNNQDDETTQVNAAPASLSGFVYVDRNDNGIFEPDERPISNVLMTLSGIDIQGRSVTRTTTTNDAGFYLFTGLTPGEYRVNQTQPAGYRDGKDTPGDNGDGLDTLDNGRVAPDLNDADDRDADAIEGIVLRSGFDAIDYNFGELAVGTSKIDFIRPARW